MAPFETFSECFLLAKYLKYIHGDTAALVLVCFPNGDL